MLRTCLIFKSMLLCCLLQAQISIEPVGELPPTLVPNTDYTIKYEITNVTDTVFAFDWLIEVATGLAPITTIEVWDFNVNYNEGVPTNCSFDRPNILNPGESNELTLKISIHGAISDVIDETIPIYQFLFFEHPVCYDIIAQEDFPRTTTSHTVVPKSSIQVFPNPVTEEINIKSLDEVQSVILYNSNMKMLRHSTTNNTSLDFKSLPSGFYFLQVTTKHEQTNFPIIKA